MKQLQVAKDFSFPPEAVTRTFGLVAMRGSGKTNAARVMAEEMFEAGLHFVAVDPAGSWWGLRSSRDGKPTGIPVPIFGGLHGDVPLGNTDGKLMADLVVDERVSCVLDLSDFSEGDKTRFLADFAERLYRRNRSPLHLFLEEADDYCLSADTEVLTATGWANYGDLVTGRSVVVFDVTTGAYKMEQIRRVIVRQHSGAMIQFKTEGIDCLITPEQRVVLRRLQRASPKRYFKYPWTFCPAANVPTNVLIPVGGAPLGKGIKGLTLTDCRVLGWLITDGSVHSAGRPYLALSQALTTRKRGVLIAEEMRRILISEVSGVTVRERPERITRAPQGMVHGARSLEFFFGPVAAKHFRHWLGSEIHQIPRAILVDGSRRQLEALYQGLMEGDGTSRGEVWRTFYPGKNEALADEFQELCLRLGIRSVKRFVPTNGCQWHVGVGLGTEHWIRRPISTTYTGPVWDITVPSGAFVCRRNGRTFVTGNCPQKPYRDQPRTLRAFENIVRRGRARGLGITMITQRSAVINKNVLTQVETMIALRTTSPQDRKAMGAWMDYHGEAHDAVASLPGLESGEAWVWSPSWLKTFRRIHFRLSRTFDSGSTPVSVSGHRPPATLAEIDLESIRKRMSVTVERANAEDPKELRKRIRALEQELRAARSKVSEAREAEVPVQAFTDAQLADMKSIAAGIVTIRAGLDAEGKRFEAVVREFSEAVRLWSNGAGKRPRDVPFRSSRNVAVPAKADMAFGERLQLAERKILSALYQYRSGRTKRQLAILTGYAVNGGGFNNAVSSLRSKNLLAGGGAGFVITVEGFNVANEFGAEPLPSGKELAEHWMGRLGKAERAILEVLLGCFPESRLKEEIADQVGYAANGGGFNNALSRLRTLELISRGASIVASAELAE